MPSGVRALTLRGTGILLVLETAVKVAPLPGPGGEPTKTRDCKAVWDTGASNTAITQAVVDDLDLKPIGLVKVHTANGTATCGVYMVALMLPNGVNVRTRATLGDIPSCDVLIGMDVITLGDFSITNVGRKTTMSFRIPSLQEVDFVTRARSADTIAGDGKPKVAMAPPAQPSRQQRRHPDKPNPKRRKH